MSKNELIFREGNMQDFAGLRQLGIASYGAYQPLLSPVEWEKLHGSLKDEEKMRALIRISTVYVCLEGDAIVGMAFFIPHGNPWDIFTGDWSYIRMVGVHPRYTGRGIAKKLTAMCIARARQTNERTIALHTSEFMDAARHIYEGFGFKVLKEIEPRLGKRYWLYTLELT